MARTRILASTLFLGSLLFGVASSGARPALGGQPCSMSQMAFSLGPYVSEATEQHTLALRLMNRGRVCVLFGYPKATLYDARGEIPFRFRRGGDQMISARPPTPVIVQRGGSAFVLLNKNVCVNGSSRAATDIKLATPKVRGGGVGLLTFPRRMAFAWRVPDGCTDAADLGWVITISPFVPTVRAALSH